MNDLMNRRLYLLAMRDSKNGKKNPNTYTTVLPCPVGEILFWVNVENLTITKGEVISLEIHKSGKYLHFHKVEETRPDGIYPLTYCTKKFKFSDVGICLFRSYDEANAAIKYIEEMEANKNE